jgi:WhiB family transcriptional regulator, redox-sensing transcriptional regulator
MYTLETGRTRSQAWAARGECRHSDPELFFPITAAAPAASQLAEAREICDRCPVRQECLTFALETGQDFGVWGGTTEIERRAIRRKELRRRRYVSSRR